MSRTVRTTRPALAVLIAVSLAVAAPAGLSVDDRSSDEERAWAPVPDAERRHGEVRLLRRGRAAVVQTVLHSKVLPQVLGRIAEKEHRNWDGSPTGREDSERYVAALRDVLPRVGVPTEADPEGERRRSLLIEFVLAPDVDVVLLGAPVVEETAGGRFVPRAVDPLARLDLGRPYVRRDMELILEDALGMTAGEAREALRSIVP